MGIHQQLQGKADRIYSLATEDIFGQLWISENGADWHREFGRITEVEPESVDEMLDRLQDAVTALTRNDAEVLNQITGTMDHWTGEAADSFRAYAGKLLDAIELQQEVLKSLQGIAQAHRDIVQAAGADALALADSTIGALEEAVHGGGGFDWNGLFTTVGLAAGVIASIATGGAATVVLAAVGAAAGVGAMATQPPAPGMTANQILPALMTSINELQNAAKAEQRALRAGLDALIEYVTRPDVFQEIRPAASVVSTTPMSPKSWDLTDFELATG